VMTNVKAMMTPTMMIRQGMTARDIVGQILQGMNATFFQSSVTPTRMNNCCSDSRALGALMLLPATEIEDIFENKDKVSMRV
jgi:redox-regulated HSP33 family molecular chaperone